MMKRMFSLLGLVVATAAATATPVQAQNYPWCEYIAGDDDGGRNCGFVSFEQCMASAFGNGSDCRPNTLYTPPFHAIPAASSGATACCGDCNGDDKLTVDELVTSVNYALNGCPASASLRASH